MGSRVVVGSRVMRVDEEVYRILVEIKASLEVATGRPCTVGEAVAFLVALSSR